MPELTAVYEGKHTGPLPRINRRYGARVVNGHAILFEAAEFRRHKKNMGVSFCATRKGAEPIDYPVDANIIVSMWKMKDSDAPIKAIFDALLWPVTMVATLVVAVAWHVGHR